MNYYNSACNCDLSNSMNETCNDNGGCFCKAGYWKDKCSTGKN